MCQSYLVPRRTVVRSTERAVIHAAFGLVETSNLGQLARLLAATPLLPIPMSFNAQSVVVEV
ncbi:uncharacterized protein UV8b_00925 [Ustilaginoidea virens]|uniref:Uncharacterized protein n=1 Tax=Ustilaginoidea virens TaxID=1159556 RepID=A0A8E5HJM6_USTVR|nr:uncharacterized protein UV8b_00925 [Ustilaginoidea virens]QUC16684.1 hypothetical protein UV8b_00925 [Ustilaginoidea virens]